MLCEMCMCVSYVEMIEGLGNLEFYYLRSGLGKIEPFRYKFWKSL